MAPPFGTILHAPGLWDIAMLLTSTGVVGDGGRDVVRADLGCGRSLPRCCSCRLERWEITPGTLPTSSGALPGTCRPLPGRIWSVARRWCGCGRWHSARCRRLLSRCRAPVGRYPIVVGTFLDAARVWEMPRGTLPTSSGAFPGPCWPLPGRSWYASSRAAAVGDGTRHVAHVVRHVAGLPCAGCRSHSGRFPCRLRCFRARLAR